MPVVNVYKYLRILFSTKLSFSVTCQDLGSTGKKALTPIMQNLSPEVFLKLFDKQVQAVLQYGTELWGLDNTSVL